MASSSRLILESILRESEKKEAILGKERKKTVTGHSAATTKFTPIEFGSLAFEVPEEPAVLKALNAKHRSAKLNSTATIDKSEPNSNKIGYKNATLWSSRSATLEQLMKPLLESHGINNWPDYETVSRVIASSAVRSELDMSAVVKPNVPMVDTLIVRLEEASEVRYGFDRLFSQWSYTSEKFELQKEWIDKIELDILVLSLVNDHYANIQLKKEQERQAAQVKAARTSVAPINIINPVASAVPVLNYGPRRKVLSEGECRTHALLRAVCPDGSTHTRPLCTSGDVLLALHELLDPTIFLHGCVQLPHVLTDTCERHTEGYYRYIYDLNGPGRWQYLRIVLPTALHALQPFVYPSAVHPSTFHVHNIAADKVPADLREASINMIKMVRKHYGKQHMLSNLVVDYEACIEVATKVFLIQQNDKTTGTRSSKFPRGAHGNTHAINMHGGNTGEDSTAPAKGVPAPHTVDNINNSQVKYRYRMLHIAETAFQNCVAGLRRDAVCFLDPPAKIFLRNFEGNFHEQWALLERQRIHERAENFMSQQGASKSLAPTKTPFADSASTKAGMQLTIDTAGKSSKSQSTRVGFADRTVPSPTNMNLTTSGANSSPSRRDVSPSSNREASNFISEMFSPRSKNLTKLSALGKGKGQDDTELDAAKEAATKLARQLFDKRYPVKTVVSKSGKFRRIADSAADGSDFSDSGDEFGAEDEENGSDNDNESYYSGSDGDAENQQGDADDPDEPPFDPSRTVFRLKSYYVATGKPLPQPVPKNQMLFKRKRDALIVTGGAPTLNTSAGGGRATLSPSRGTIGATTIVNVEPEAAVSRPSMLVPKAPHPHHKHANHRVSVVATAINAAAGTLSSGGAGTVASQQSPNIAHRKSRNSIVVGSKDRQILARYHITEAHRIEHERKKAEEERVRAETAARLAAENEAAIARRKATLYSLYFVTRTFFKRPDTVEPVRSKSPQSHASIAVAAAAVLGGGASATGDAEDGTTAEERRAAHRHSKRPSVVAATAALTARRKGRRGATQALDVSAMTEADAARVYAEDQVKYREAMDSAAMEFLSQSLSSREKGNLSGPNREGVTVDKELFLAIGDLLHRTGSPTKGKDRTGGAISPSKMFEEMNKTPESYPERGPKPKIRNDVEFDERAYKLAEKIDLTYLVSSFDPANHSRGKQIVLDEDQIVDLAQSSVLSGEAAECVEESPQALHTASTEGADSPTHKPALNEAEQTKTQAREYAEYMKKVYDEEMTTMLDNLIDHLPDQLAGKVRKALAAKKHRLKLKKRQAYINRRRKVEEVRTEDINILQKFYEGQTFLPGDCMTDSSSEDEAERKAKQAETDRMLGDLANVGEEEMQAMLEARAAAEAAEKAEQEAAEAKRLLKEQMDAEKRERKAKAKADRLAAQQAAAIAAAMAAATAAVDGTADPAAGTEVGATAEATTAAVRRGSIAQMRRTFRTFSLMHLTKVLLDGTMVPKVEEAVVLPPSGPSRIGTAGAVTDPSAADSDSEHEADCKCASRPVTAVVVKYSDSGLLDTVDDTVGGGDGAGAEDARPGTFGRPTSRDVSRPSTRGTMWDLPPLGRAVSPAASTPASIAVAVAVTAKAAISTIPALMEEPSEATGTEHSEEAEAPSTETACSGEKLQLRPVGLSNLDSTIHGLEMEASAYTKSELADLHKSTRMDGPESELSQSNSVDSDMLDLLSDIKLNAATQPGVPPTDTFVHRRATRAASICSSVSVQKVAADGRPPSGLLFNMVKPGTPSSLVSNLISNPLQHSGSKGSPMDKLMKTKELPKPHISKLKKLAPKSEVKFDAAASNAPHDAKVGASAGSEKQQVPPPAPPATQPSPPPPAAKPKGLYIIPGTPTVATFAQKPVELKPSRPIVYTTRVLMQQKIREFMNSPAARLDGFPVPGAVHAFFASSSSVVAAGSAQLQDNSHDTTDSDLHFRVGDSGMHFTDSIAPDSAEMSAADVEVHTAPVSAPGVASEAARMYSADASIHFVTTVPAVGSISAGIALDAMPPQAVSDSESDCEGGKLQLSVAEWNLILDAAREQAMYLDLDILQKNELEDQMCSMYDNAPEDGVEADGNDDFAAHLDAQFGGSVIPVSSFEEYYGEEEQEEDIYPVSPLTVGRALRLYGENQATVVRTEVAENTSAAPSHPVSVPTLASVGAGCFNLYARVSHTAQGGSAPEQPSTQHPAAEVSLLDQFLKTAGAPPIPASVHYPGFKSSHHLHKTTATSGSSDYDEVSPSSQRKHSSPQHQRELNRAPHVGPHPAHDVHVRATTPKSPRRVLFAGVEPEQNPATNDTCEVPALEATLMHHPPEPIEQASPLTITKLVRPASPSPQSPKSQRKLHGQVASLPAVVTPSTEEVEFHNPKSITVSIPVLVGEDAHSHCSDPATADDDEINN